MKRTLSFIFLTVLSFVVYAQNNQQTLKVYSAREYVNLWSGNKLQAEQQYKNKLVAVSGTVLAVDRTIFGNVPYVDLDINIPFGGVTCEFPESKVNTIINLKKGDRIIIVGYAESAFRIMNCYIRQE